MAHRAVGGGGIERASGFDQPAKGVVGVGGELVVGVGLSELYAKAGIVGEGRCMAETGGNGGWEGLGEVESRGGRAAEGIGG